jgi:hypothetical protein
MKFLQKKFFNRYHPLIILKVFTRKVFLMREPKIKKMTEYKISGKNLTHT